MLIYLTFESICEDAWEWIVNCKLLISLAFMNLLCLQALPPVHGLLRMSAASEALGCLTNQTTSPY